MKKEDIDFIIQNYKNEKPGIKEDVKDEISEEEAIQIYNEILAIFTKHNLSYKCGFNISVSLMYALMTGAAEIFDMQDD